jgi:hypothetical protein
MTVRSWWARLRGTLRRKDVDREMDREMEIHLDMLTQRNVERGMPLPRGRG